MYERRIARSARLAALLTWAAITWVSGIDAVGAALHGSLEAPGGVATQVGNVQGWTYTTNPGAELIQPFDVLIDGVKVMEVPCCSSRGDVKDQRPEAPLQTGFSGVLNWAREALSTTGPITVSVVVRDTAGDTLTLERTVEAHVLSAVPFLRSVSFRGLGAADEAPLSPTASHCKVIHEVRTSTVNGEPVDEVYGGFACAGLVLRGGGPGAPVPEPCEGFVHYLWNTGAQGFVQTTSCEPLSRWEVSEDGYVLDGTTGLMWERKTSTDVAAWPLRCDGTDDPLACDDPHYAPNTYTWTTLLKRRNGSAFSTFLAQLNDAHNLLGVDEAPPSRCYAGYCDWRLPTIEELRSIFRRCPEETCDEASQLPEPLTSGVYASSTLTSDLDSFWGLDTATGRPIRVDIESYAHVIAVRGVAFRDSND